MQTMVQLTDELVELLDAEAARQGSSRSAVIRDAIGAYLADVTEQAITDRIVDGYRRLPPATPDEWGDVTDQAAVSTEEVAQRLAAEERAAGFEPW